MNEYLKRYLKEKWWTWQVKRWLSANDERLVADAMFKLNRLARHVYYEKRIAIYAVKNVLVRYLYQHGHCEHASLQRQEFECWDCDGTGTSNWDGEYCEKCDGTGVYRSHLLYQFVFNINGQRYVWHQPEEYVNWHVAGVDDQQEPLAFKASLSSPPYDSAVDMAAHLYIRLIVAYLRSKGIPAKSLPSNYSLRLMLKDWWHDSYFAKRWRWYVRPYVRERAYNVRKLIHFVNTGSFEDQQDDWIPF